MRPSGPRFSDDARQPSGKTRGAHAGARWILLVALGCATSGLEGNVYRHGDVKFRVGPVPADWRQLDDELGRSDLAAFAFRAENAGATIGAAGRCNRDGDDIPLKSLTQHLHLGFTNREIQSETPQTLDGRDALRTQMSASLDGVQKHLTFVVLKKDGCVYDFWRIADQAPTHGTEDFDRFVAGFQTLK